MRKTIFISYRRDKGYELAHLVDAELRSRGLRTFIDVSESDPGQFWPQIRAAIESCRAFVLICSNGSLEPRTGDDWVLREVSEAIAHGRPIVPVFSQNFRRPAVMSPELAQATESNGVSMDTQFHVAAFDHLSQLVGGRKRAEQRRRVALSAGLAVLALLGSLALGGREIYGLAQELGRERDARKAADARSEDLAKSVGVLERAEADIRRATEESERIANEQAKTIVNLERLQAANRRAAEERDRLAKEQADKRERERSEAEQSAAVRRRQEDERRQWRATLDARDRAESEAGACLARCRRNEDECGRGASNERKTACNNQRQRCESDCRDALHRICSSCSPR
jgi:TIR domain